MLFRHMGSGDSHLQTMWQELGDGAPTIIGFASLCAASMGQSMPSPDNLSPEAKTILVAARDRGVMDIRGNREPIDSSERLLAVCVEIDNEQRLHFLQRDQPEQTIRFLDGFRQLCQSGLAIHHLQREFSLTANGFQLARQLDRDEYAELIQFAEEVLH